MKWFSSIRIGLQLWGLTAFLAASGISVYFSITETELPLFLFFIVFLVCGIVSLPALVMLMVILKLIRDNNNSPRGKILQVIGLLAAIAIIYGTLISIIDGMVDLFRVDDPLGSALVFFASTFLVFFIASLAATISHRFLSNYLFQNPTFILQHLQSNFKTNKSNMEPSHSPATTSASNKILVKGLITGGLILLLLIPTIFISNLIKEREARQKEVVAEVSSKWASAQTLSSPFLVVPYSYPTQTSDGKSAIAHTNLIFLANEVAVNGNIIPEQRPRSIYKVLLYKSGLNFNGNFKVELPTDIDSSRIDYKNAKLCFTLSDFKGIEENIYVQFNNEKLLLRPGLPLEDFGRIGLSAPVKIAPDSLAAGLAFTMDVKLKGSEQLHFIPMSASSQFNVQSAWNDPSFDGEMLPNERQVDQNGFNARWNFNQANLPFATVIRQNTVGDKKFHFGVSLVQPADQYDKTMRSVKYAILFIGLTFAFFFIIELMQKKPFHPVQYVLVGIALVIFYTLLLSISEYLPFDNAYVIAALATVMLISLYAKGHFKSWKTAGIFFLLLSLLYSFIFVLIRLEDTALLVGSIGLFVVLALVMFASQKINWYGKPVSSVTDLSLQNEAHV